MSDTRTTKPARPGKRKVSRAPRASLATSDANPGVEVSSAPSGPNQASLPVHADVHQGKHIDGDWKDYDEGKGTVSFSRLASYENTALLKLSADALPWATIGSTGGGFDYMLECTAAVAAGGEIHVWIQGGMGKAKGKPCFSFHAIPIDDTTMITKLRTRGFYQHVDISNLV